MQNHLYTLFEEYLPNRRDVLSRHAKSRDNQELVNTALYAAANQLVDTGNFLTSVARTIGQALDPEGTDKAQTKLGGRFLNFLHTNGLIDFSLLRKDDNTTIYTVDMIDDSFSELIHGMSYEKRVSNITIKPDDWHKPFNRGVPIVKKLTSEDAHRYTIEQMPEYYKALNVLQSSRWTVNTDILDLMADGLDYFSPVEVSDEEKGEALAALMTSQRIALSIEEKELLKAADKYPRQAAKRWSKAKADDYFATKGEQFRKVVSAHSQMNSFVDTVQFAADVEYETLYFQHNLDSRGRVYALSPSLSPQGNDAQKALLKFQDPQPIDEFWMKVHIANCAGQDKLTYEGRNQWVDDNIDNIIATGTDARSNLEWLVQLDAKGNPKGVAKEKKTKWQFIAACIEWVKYTQTGDWKIPVGIDATSSGLQFLAAISRDENIAEDVNISNCSYAPVGDIYQKAGNKLIELLDPEKASTLGNFEHGDKSLRKLCKRSAMTLSYGCGAKTMGKHTFQDRKDHGVAEFDSLSWNECQYLGDLQYESLKQLLPRSFAVMEAMQNSFNGYTGGPIARWTSPAGFPAYQYKPSVKKEQLRLVFDKHDDIQVVLYTALDKASISDMKLGVSANIIHSCDASLMVRTINAMADAGVTDFHAVHDCFGVAPGKVDILGVKAREAFYSIIVNDPIEKMMIEMTGNYDTPEKGNWNPSDVLTARYFLC